MKKKALEAVVRTEISKSARSTIRQAGKVPGILYAKTLAPIPVAVFENAINPFVFTAETHIISVKLDNQQEYDCILKDVQFDPVTDRIIHFDLQGLVSGETIEVEVPVLFVGIPVGVRDGGLLQQFFHKVSVKCVPASIPENIEIDVTGLKIGDAVHARDIKIEGVELVQSEDSVIVQVSHPKVEEEAAPAEAEAAEPEVIAKGKEKTTEE
jgi:large subunit ribosomal protein L25